MPTKVARLIESYDLEGFGTELEDRWTGSGYERESLRALARRFNIEVLGVQMDRAGLSPLEGEVENTYRLLRSDEVSAGMRVQAERELERAGIDVDSLRRDFVSHQAIHTYLTSDRGAEGPGSRQTPAERLEKDIDSVQRLASRLGAVTEDTIDRFSDGELLSDEETSVIVDVTVLCEACGEQYDGATYLESGGCGCLETDE